MKLNQFIKDIVMHVWFPLKNLKLLSIDHDMIKNIERLDNYGKRY